MSTVNNTGGNTQDLSNVNAAPPAAQNDSAPSSQDPVTTPPQEVAQTTEAKFKIIDDTEEFIVTSKKQSTERIDGTHTAKIIDIRGKDISLKTAKVTRYFFDIELDTRRTDGSSYMTVFSCLKCWKPGSEYQEFVGKVLGRPLNAVELDKGVKPHLLKHIPFTVFVTERIKKKGGSELILHEIKSLPTLPAAVAA